MISQFLKVKKNKTIQKRKKKNWVMYVQMISDAFLLFCLKNLKGVVIILALFTRELFCLEEPALNKHSQM